jgi:hypothetical protein
MAGVAALSPCVVTFYECPKDKDTVDKLAAAADKQQEANPENRPFDIAVLPWTNRCDDGYVDWHFVATDGETICGWLAAKLHAFRGGKQYVYLREISTRRPGTAGWRKGVGTALHEAFVKKATEKGVAFIYLYPINEGVSELYQKAPWSYNPFPPNEGIKHLYRIVAGTEADLKNEVFLRPLRPRHPRQLTAELDRLINEQKLTDPKVLADVRRRVLGSKEFTTELEDILNEMSVNEMMDESEANKELVMNFIEKVRATKGGRRTRRRFKQPRLMSKKYCKKTPCRRMGFTQKASCRPYKNCYTRRR